MQSPHDTLFQFTFRHAGHAAGWLRSVLPAPLAAAIDWTQLASLRERFPGVRVRPHLADAAFAAPLVAPRDQSVLLLVEHKSSFDAAVDVQLLRYSIHLQRALQSSPRVRPFVVAVVLQHGVGAARPSADAADAVLAALSALQPRQHVFVDDLDATTEAALAARGLSPLAELTLLCLRTLRDCPPDDVPACFDRWRHLLRAVDRTDAPPLAPPLGEDAVDTVGWYALAATNVESLRLAETLARILHRPEDTIMSTLERTYQKGISQGLTLGRMEGRSEGRSEGRTQGRAETILRQLQRRFGPLPEDVTTRIRAGTEAEFDRWTDRVLDAGTLAEVLAQ